MGYRHTFELDYGKGVKKQYHQFCYQYRKTTTYARCKSMINKKEIKSFKVFVNSYVQVEEQFASECEGVQQKSK